MFFNPVQTNVPCHHGSEPPDVVAGFPTMQSLYRRCSSTCSCLDLLLVPHDLFGMWETFSDPLLEMMEGGCESNFLALKHTLVWKLEQLNIHSHSVDELSEDEVAEAVVWLHRILPQQQEICTRLGEQWPVLDIIARAPCDQCEDQRQALRALCEHLSQT